MSILPEAMALQLLNFSSFGIGQDCVLCGAAAGARLVCAACDARLPRCGLEAACGLCEGAEFDEAHALFDYRFPVDALIHRFKFGADLAMGRWLGDELAAALRGGSPPAWIVAPPLTAARLRERGFNQALELAKVVARATGARLEFAALAKLRETAAQASLGPRERRRNLRGAFACRRELQGAPVAIVDDVLTTGATADALASALREAGAGRVSVWAVALAPDPRR
jgi:ComF family protein